MAGILYFMALAAVIGGLWVSTSKLEDHSPYKANTRLCALLFALGHGIVHAYTYAFAPDFFWRAWDNGPDAFLMHGGASILALGLKYAQLVTMHMAKCLPQKTLWKALPAPAGLLVAPAMMTFGMSLPLTIAITIVAVAMGSLFIVNTRKAEP